MADFMLEVVGEATALIEIPARRSFVVQPCLRSSTTDRMAFDPEPQVDRIYEASLVPELWQLTIDGICAVSGSATGSIICINERDRTVRGIASEFAEETFQEFARDPDSWNSKRMRRGLAADSAMWRAASLRLKICRTRRSWKTIG